MAETKSMLQQLGLTPGRAALIGVLAVALVGVVYTQYLAPGGDEPVPPAAPAYTRPAQPTPAPIASSATPAAKAAEIELPPAAVEFDETRWQPPKLTEVIAFDPFALPASFPQPTRAVIDPQLAAESPAALNAEQLATAVEELQRQLLELQQRGVHVIVNLRDEYVAMIGDRTIHVGDEINGFIVTAIEPDGVRVERKSIE